VPPFSLPWRPAPWAPRDDHLEVGAQGVSGKAAVVGFVASPARVTSMYVNRGGRWLNVLYQQTPIGGK
jgi:hypothetical protein